MKSPEEADETPAAGHIAREFQRAFDCFGSAAGRTRLNVVEPWFSTRKNPHPMKIVAEDGSWMGVRVGWGAGNAAGGGAAGPDAPGAAATAGRAGTTGAGRHSAAQRMAQPGGIAQASSSVW